MNFVAIDVETAIGKRWSICQIGLAIVENGKIIKTISKLVKPPNNEYSQWNINVHGITPERTENKPLFPEVWEEIYPFLAGKKLVAHNASFDMNCLQQTLEFYDLLVPELECYCTFKMTGQKLNIACDAYGIELLNHHDASDDAVACAEVYLKVSNGDNPDISKFKSKKTNKELKYGGFDKLSGDVLNPDLENADCNHPFYAKKIVFTGVLGSISRKDAAQMVKKLGADIDSSISKKTNFVITGNAPGPSKMKKIQQFNNLGSNIQILEEKEFFKICE